MTSEAREGTGNGPAGAAWTRLKDACGRLFRHPRYQVMAGLVALMFLLEDRCFPFSNFPMYGDFPDRTHYVYLADGTGAPLPLHDLFGYRTTFLKRIYSSKVRRQVEKMEQAGEKPEWHLLTAEQLRPMGDETLRWLVSNKRKKAPSPAELQLIHVDVELRDGKLVKHSMVVGKFRGGPGL